MTKTEMKEIIKKSIEQKMVCNVYFRYDYYYWNLIPLESNDRFFMSAKEDDFILDGYTVRRFKDLKKVTVANDMRDKILRINGIIDGLQTPPVDISDWKAVFESLKRVDKNIIVEKESLNDDEWEFIIGRIENVYNRFAYVRHFDADGVWQDEPYKIPYSEITSITFSSRYVDTFSKYISAPPQAKRG